MYDLSILIPAKDERFLARTIADIVEHKEGKTEVIVVLDGAWAEPGITDHPDVTIIYLSESIGQRAATNLACRLSKAKYVMKLDAHCSFDQGFDVKMIKAFKEAGDNVTMVPVMRNLHVFNWKCQGCGKETYQGPVPEGCDECDVNHFDEIIKWIPKQSPQSTAYRFNRNLRFKYFPELRRRQKGNLVETMSLQGSCFMMTRDKYWELDICDENWGSWGQQGTEVALKTWLSGGRVLCNMDTWYAHLFRTQRGFSHPWGNPGKSQQNAIKVSQDLFFNNKWEKQVRSLSWLLDKFWDSLKEVKDPESWREQDLVKLRKKKMKGTKGMLFYTDNQLALKIAHRVQRQLRKISEEKNIPITSVSLKKMNLGTNIHLPLQRGKIAMYTQILVGLESMKEEIVFMCEHDVLYHPSHFDFMPERKDMFYYDQNWWKVWPDGFAAHWDANQVSGLCAYRDHLIAFYRERLKEIEENGAGRSYEPGSKDKKQYQVWNSELPSVDFRHGNNVTRSHRSPRDFRDKSSCVNWQESTVDKISGWEGLSGIMKK